MIIGPIRPEFVSLISSVCEWYIHMTDGPSCMAGPARCGTSHVYVTDVPGATASSALSAPEVPSSYGAPSELLAYRTPCGCMLYGRVALFLKTTLMVSPTSARIVGPRRPVCSQRASLGLRVLNEASVYSRKSALR